MLNIITVIIVSGATLSGVLAIIWVSIQWVKSLNLVRIHTSTTRSLLSLLLVDYFEFWDGKKSVWLLWCHFLKVIIGGCRFARWIPAVFVNFLNFIIRYFQWLNYTYGLLLRRILLELHRRFYVLVLAVFLNYIIWELNFWTNTRFLPQLLF